MKVSQVPTPRALIHPAKMAFPTVGVRFVIPRNERALELGNVKVSLKVFDPAKTLQSLRKAQAEVAAQKAAMTAKFITEPKVQGHLLCKAVTLSGTPCKARASCGAYCKRHFFVSK
jgi:hypothetical protein